MAEAAGKYQKELERIKKNIEKSYEYFSPNYIRFNKFRKFVFKSTMTDSDLTLTDARNMPQMEFNICEAFISRQRGEFSKQQPSFSVSNADNSPEIDVELQDFLEGHLRYILFEANNDSFEYNIYTDELSGGFSVGKVWTDYTNEMSFVQDIRIGRAFDPVMCGFDPLAQKPHKGDGNYSYEIFPMLKDDFERDYPHIDIKDVGFTGSLSKFSWSYRSNLDDFLLIADYFEKKKKRTKIVRLSNGKTLQKKDYEDYLIKWQLQGHIEQPAMIIDERMTDITVICRYRLIENQVINYRETDLPGLPHIYFGGNTQLLRDPDNSTVEEVSRPYIYHLMDTQKMKNLAGQTWANGLENLIQHKFKVAEESIPDEEDYRAAYTDVQNASTLVYKSFLNYDPSSPTPPVQIPPPMEIQNIPMPPEVMNAFMACDRTAQSILGSYDASLGINDNQLSGVAIVEGATQSNSAAMPYLVGYMQGFNQMAQMILDLIPKYYVTPRSVPIIDKEGKRGFTKINTKDGLKIEYSPRSLKVKVEAGVNYAIAKNRAIMQVVSLSQAIPQFGAFINAKGLPYILDNLEIKNIDQLKELAQQWTKEQAQAQAQAMQNNPIMKKIQLAESKLQLDATKEQNEFAVEKEKASIERQYANNDTMKIMVDMNETKEDRAVEMMKAQAEKDSDEKDLAIKTADLHHKHAKETLETLHSIQKQPESGPKG
jgi:hypothetical protein